MKKQLSLILFLLTAPSLTSAQGLYYGAKIGLVTPKHKLSSRVFLGAGLHLGYNFSGTGLAIETDFFAGTRDHDIHGRISDLKTLAAYAVYRHHVSAKAFYKFKYGAVKVHNEIRTNDYRETGHSFGIGFGTKNTDSTNQITSMTEFEYTQIENDVGLASVIFYF